MRLNKKRAAVIILLLLLIISLLQRNTLINQYKKIQYHFAYADLDEITIELSDSLYGQLIAEKDSVLKIILEDNLCWGIDEKKQYKAKFIKDHFRYKSKVKLAGHYSDHLRRSPFSIRIKIKNGNYKGMSHFTLLNPITRFLHVDIFANYLCADFKIKTLKTYPIKGCVNGDNHLYLFEEGFSSKSLNNDSIGWIIEEKVSPEFGFKARKSNKEIIRYCDSLNNLSTLYPHVNLEKFAYFFALSDLFQSTHQNLDINRHYILNASSNKLEPIGREFWFASENYITLFIDQVMADTENEFGRIAHELFKDEYFINLYYASLNRISEKDFVTNIYNENNKEINKINILYWQKYAWFDSGLNENSLKKNQELIMKLLSKERVSI